MKDTQIKGTKNEKISEGRLTIKLISCSKLAVLHAAEVNYVKT